MKDYALLFGRSIFWVIACAMIGFILLIGVYAIPTNKIEENVEASAYVFMEEGTYPTIKTGGVEYSLDNWTDSLMLMMAAYSTDDTPLQQALLNYRPFINGENSSQAIVSHYIDGEEWGGSYSYGRYWHGYLVILKPLLLVLSYSGIRILNFVMVCITTILIIILMYRRKMTKYIIPYLITLMIIHPYAVSKSIQFSAVYYTYAIAAIIFLFKRDWFMARKERFVLFFVTVGCITSYVDLLTYPLVSYGILAVIMLCSSEKSLKENAKLVLLTIIGWFIGYIGMWGLKWVLATLLSEVNVIESALSQIAFRSSTQDSSGNEFSIIEVIAKNLYYLFVPAVALAAVYTIIAFIFSIKNNIRNKLCNHTWILYIGIALLPFIWYIGASNHSYIHAWMTFRELSITVFSITCMVTSYIGKKKQDNNFLYKKII